MTKFSRYLSLIIICLTLSSATLAQDGPVEQALSAFDQRQQHATANAFFQLLDKEQFTESLLQFAPQVPLDSVRQQVWYWGAEWFYDRNEYERARRYASRALPHYSNNSGDKADCLNLLGCIYVRLGDFNQAATYAKQCLNIDLTSGDHDRISSSMNTLAGIYMAAKQNDEAEKWILQAIGHADKANNPARKAVLMGTAAEIYHSLTREQEALDYARQAYDIERQMASALMGLKRYDEAEKALRMAIPVMREQGELHSLAIACNHLGTALIWQKRDNEAYPYYREAANLFVRMGDPINELYARRGLCLSLWESHPDSARAELNRFNYLKDSLYTHDATETLARINAEFGNDRLQQEMDRERQAHIRDIIIVIVAVLVLMAAGWYAYMRQRRAHLRRVSQLVREVSQLRLTLEAVTQDTQPAEPTDGAVTDDELQRRIIRCIDDDTTGDYSLEALATQLGIGATTLRRRLQRITGDSPKTYIQAIVMDKARRLLDQGGTVADVAQACGYAENSSFTRAFKRVFGETPTEYRNCKS